MNRVDLRGENVNPKYTTIGIIGGGQLGKMLIQEAKKMDFKVIVLDPSPDAPAGRIADDHIIAGFYDKEKIRELVTKCDVTTFELENIDAEELYILEKKGHKIFPSPRTLEKIKDKSIQKEILEANNIPTSKWERIEDIKETAKSLGFPFVQKSCRGGYDGRGVFVIKAEKDFENALSDESFGEKFVDFQKELAVMVSRGIDGETKCYPVVDMVFDEGQNICDLIIAPGKIDGEIEKKAMELAMKSVEVFEGVGVFGVEMFLTKDGQVLINEIAPRVHNSGHYTIEGCVTSQFEQHIRAICGIPLGSTELIIPSVVMNILGEENANGTPYYEGFKDALSIAGVNIHIYGKDLVKPYRKMGHVTIVDKDVDIAIEKSNKVRKVLSTVSMEGDNGE